MVEQPLVSIIIPHYLGDVLSECLGFVYGRTHGVPFEVIVADDQPYDDGSLARALAQFPDVRVVETGGGKGMGAGCNRGLGMARGRYAFLLNNDVEVAEGWLPPLLAAVEEDDQIGVCQPKVLSLRNRERFDYGGAAGGLMDSLGFTFCRGRLFETVEEDRGQYDAVQDIFWAVGGAMLLRLSRLESTGQMDEAFWMHMEEIDLCWRFHAAGYRVVCVPQSVVYHYGGLSLDADSFRKAYLNHRNQMVMVLKNFSLRRLLWVFPVRVGLELTTVLLLLKGNWKHPLAALRALLWIATHPLSIFRRRRMTQQRKRVQDGQIAERMYRGSVAFAYYVRGVRIASELLDESKG